LDALILAGGLGTRLRSAVTDRAKSVAPVSGRPFLSYVLDHLSRSGRVSRFILCTGHQAGTVRSALGAAYAGIRVAYSEEDQPLGTGGALRQAIVQFALSRQFMVLNGDTILRLRIGALIDFHRAQKADLTLALSYARSAERYGTVSLKGERITSFAARGSTTRGWINGGIYVFSTGAAKALLDMPERFSIENDFFPAQVARMRCAGYRARAAFLDIGTPEDYLRATALLLGK
jgi:D-glycero-alpha-D-manno-heptose 1-phosphate guanylyltransferase